MKQHAKTNRYLGGGVFPWFKVVDYGNIKLIEKNDTTWEYEREKFLNIKKIDSANAVSKHYKIPIETLLEHIKSVEINGSRSFGKNKMNFVTNKIESNKKYQIEENVYPALLKKEEQDELLEIIKSNRRGDHKGKIYKYLFSDLLYCNLCARAKKRKLGGNKFTKRGIDYYYYKCPTCSRKLNVEKADKVIINNILEMNELKILNKANLKMFDTMQEISDIQKEKDSFREEQEKLLDKILNISITNIDIKERLEKKVEKEINDIDKIIDSKNKKIELLRIQLKDSENNSFDTDTLNQLRFILLNKTSEDHEDIRQMINLLDIKIHVRNYERMTFEIRFS